VRNPISNLPVSSARKDSTNESALCIEVLLLHLLILKQLEEGFQTHAGVELHELHLDGAAVEVSVEDVDGVVVLVDLEVEELLLPDSGVENREKLSSLVEICLLLMKNQTCMYNCLQKKQRLLSLSPGT
jgi:hypothetical protein